VSDVFDEKTKASRKPEINVKSLRAKIGQLALKIDFSEGALDKAGLLPSARKFQHVTIQPAIVVFQRVCRK